MNSYNSITKFKQFDCNVNRDPEQTFSRRHTDGQQVHKIVLNNTNHLKCMSKPNLTTVR